MNLKRDAEQNTVDCMASLIKCKAPGKPSDGIRGRGAGALRCRAGRASLGAGCASSVEKAPAGGSAGGGQGWTCHLHMSGKTPR